MSERFVSFRAPFYLLFLMFCLSTSLAAQTAAYSSADDSVAAPQQLRRMPPPSPEMSAQQLEARGDEYRAEKYYADAIDYYSAAIAREPKRAQLFNKMGIAHLQMQNHRDAQKSFERAVKLDKSLAEAHNNLGVVHYMKRENNRAVKEYRAALKLNPESASFHNNLGSALFARKEYDKASAEYVRALEIDPEIFDRTSRSGLSARVIGAAEKGRYNYVIAKMFARKGDSERTLLYLRKSLEAGFIAAKNAKDESEFDGVKNDPRFAALMNESFPRLK